MQLCMAWMSIAALVHSEDDDVICNPVVVLHNHNAHHIGAGTHDPSPAPEHCFICHNLSLRSLVASAEVSSPVSTEQPLVADSVRAIDASLVTRRPARAPPLA